MATQAIRRPVAKTKLPYRTDLAGATLRALAALGGSATAEEVAAQVTATLGLSQRLAKTHIRRDPRCHLDHEVHFALSLLKRARLLDGAPENRWVLTADGERLLAEEASDTEIRELVLASRRKPRGYIPDPLVGLRDLPIPTERSDDPTLCTYLVQATRGGPTKAGWSTLGGVLGRLADHQTGNPERLVIRRLVAGGYPTEQAILRHFAHLRMEGEWLYTDPELAVFARAMPQPPREAAA